MNYAKSRQAIEKNRNEMGELQAQASSMKKINKPSDDPVAMTKILTARSELQGVNQYLKNLEVAKQFLNYTDQALEELTNALVRAKELTLSQANDPSANADSRKAVAAEIAQIYDHVVQVSNRRMNDRFIFGGYMTTKKPFNDQGDYSGDKGEMMIEVTKGTYVPMNVPGSMVFYGEDLAKQNMARISKNAPTTTEQLDVSVKEHRELYVPQEHQEKKSDFDIEDSVQTRGPASTRATVRNDNSEAKNLKYSKEQSEFGENIFATLTALQGALQTNDKSGIQDSLDRIDKSIDQAVQSRAKVGSRATQLEATMQTLYGTNFNERANLSNIEDTDSFEIFSEMSKNENALKATMASSAKILQPSLLDFLR